MRKNTLLRDNWKDYFNFSKRLRNGLYVLFSILVIQIVILLWLHFTPASNKPMDVTQFQKEVDEFYASLKKDSTTFSEEGGNITSKIQPELFSFNPNNLPEEDWNRLGFSDRQIQVIKNYESKGGKFRTKADVKKMYCISAEEYAAIESFIVIPAQQSKDSTSHSSTYKKYERPVVMVDIGTADTLELLKLPAVGPAFARRISNYRDKLGGFYSINQLKEVWGLTDSMFQIIAPHIILKDSTNLRRMNINTADYKEFNMHPYIDKALASVIISYRNQHGVFHSIDEIKKVSLFTQELYSKLAPYLKIE